MNNKNASKRLDRVAEISVVLSVQELKSIQDIINEKPIRDRLVRKQLLSECDYSGLLKIIESAKEVAILQHAPFFLKFFKWVHSGPERKIDIHIESQNENSYVNCHDHDVSGFVDGRESGSISEAMFKNKTYIERPRKQLKFNF